MNRAALTAAVAALFASTSTPAAVTTDGSLGVKQSLSGAKVAVPASLGRLKGGNLFHSFGRFDVDAGQTVTFTGPTSVKNVLARVTGGRASRIDGTLASGIGGANVYLINPAGVAFGPGGRLDVSGTFTATTADAVTLADGRAFAVNGGNDAVLTGASPSAFGFTSAKPAAITVNGATLTAPSARLVGGGVTLTDAVLTCPAGRIDVAAVTGGDVAVDGRTGRLVPAASAGGGRVSLTDATLSVDGRGGGRIGLHAADLTMTRATLSARTLGVRDGRGIDVALSGDLDAVDSLVNASTTAAGRAGDVSLTAASARFRQADAALTQVGVLARSEADATGAGGHIVMRAGALALLDGAYVSTTTFGRGDSGAVDVTATRLRLAGQTGAYNSGLFATTLAGVDGGAGGTVTVHAKDLRMADRGIVSAGTFGSGPGGDVSVVARRLSIGRSATIASSTSASGVAGSVAVRAGTLAIDGGNATTVATGILSQANSKSTGPAGRVVVTADTLSVAGGGAISSTTFGGGRAGAIAVRAGDVSVAGSVAASVSSGILSNAAVGSRGVAGTVMVTADHLALREYGGIASGTASSGAAGTVGVRAGTLTIDARGGPKFVTGIASQANAASSGRAGDVTVSAGTLALRNGGKISSNTFGSGNAGTVRVDAGRIDIANDLALNFGGGIVSDAAIGSTGSAGRVSVTADTLAVRDYGGVSSNASATGDAGSVAVRARTLTIDGRVGPKFLTGIASQANAGASGDAGAVSVAARHLRLFNGGLIGSNTFGPGRGGTVRVRAGNANVDGGSAGRFTGISSTTGSASGDAGGVDVRADTLRLTQGGRIASTSSGPGDAGTVSVRAGDLAVDGRSDGDTFTGINSNSNGTGAGGRGGDVRVSARRLSLLDQGEITSDTQGGGRAGDVTVVAGAVRLDGRTQGDGSTDISSESLADGRGGAAGDVTVRADTLDVLHGGSVATDTNGLGAGGRLNVVARAVRVSGLDDKGTAAYVSSDSNNDHHGGPAGDLTLRSDTLRLSGGGFIEAQTSGSGRAGSIDLRVRHLLSIRDAQKNLTGIETDTINSGHGGRAGDVTIHAGRIEVLDTGYVSSESDGLGDAGRVTVRAHRVVLGGTDANDNVTAIESSSVPGGAGGDAGSVSVRADRVDVLAGGRIASDTGGRGAAGDVSVRAGTLAMHGGPAGGLAASVQSRSLNHVRGGPAGSVTVDCDRFTAAGRAYLSASTNGTGDAGTLRLDAGVIDIAGVQSGLFAATYGRFHGGDGGDIDVSADRMTLADGALVTAQTQGHGRAGDVRMTVGDLTVRDGAAVQSLSTSAGASGRVAIDCGSLSLTGGATLATSARRSKSGDIAVRAAGGFDAIDSTISTRSRAGNAGDVTLAAGEALTLTRSTVSARAGANGAALTLRTPVAALGDRSVLDGRANGRRVKVSLDRSSVLLRSLSSVIYADNPVLPPDVDLTGALVRFLVPGLDGQTVLAEGCDEQLRQRRLSSFSGRERLGAPPPPGGAVGAAVR